MELQTLIIQNDPEKWSVVNQTGFSKDKRQALPSGWNSCMHKYRWGVTLEKDLGVTVEHKLNMGQPYALVANRPTASRKNECDLAWRGEA